jgi:hypothetical protein
MQRSDGELMQHWGEKYRELARECLRVASTTITAESRSLLVEMARVWTRLADEQNIRAQQQKIQSKKDEATSSGKASAPAPREFPP